MMRLQCHSIAAREVAVQAKEQKADLFPSGSESTCLTVAFALVME